MRSFLPTNSTVHAPAPPCFSSYSAAIIARSGSRPERANCPNTKLIACSLRCARCSSGERFSNASIALRTSSFKVMQGGSSFRPGRPQRELVLRPQRTQVKKLSSTSQPVCFQSWSMVSFESIGPSDEHVSELEVVAPVRRDVPPTDLGAVLHDPEVEADDRLRVVDHRMHDDGAELFHVGID